MPKKLLTLCLIHNDTHVLLGLKKRGFGEGRWNGFGGKLAEGETVEQAAFREIKEEIGVVPKDLAKRGVMDFEFSAKGGSSSGGQGNPEIMEVHLFSAREYEGEPKEGEEMRPKWFAKNEIPFDKMWPDDRYWFPLFFAGKNFNAKFLFGENDEVISYEIKEI